MECWDGIPFKAFHKIQTNKGSHLFLQLKTIVRTKERNIKLISTVLLLKCDMDRIACTTQVFVSRKLVISFGQWHIIKVRFNPRGEFRTLQGSYEKCTTYAQCSVV